MNESLQTYYSVKEARHKEYTRNNSISVSFKHWLNRTVVTEFMRVIIFGVIICMGKACRVSRVPVNDLFLDLVDDKGSVFTLCKFIKLSS